MHYVRIKYKDFVVWLDKADEAMFHTFKWYPNPKGYLRRNNWVQGKNKNIMLHRLLAGASLGEQVDHINHNIHDNRKCNLRICTAQENSRHCKTPSKSGFKGVYDNRHGKWAAMIRVDSKLLHLGTFSNKEDAARTYDAAAHKYFGEFALANFPREIG